MAQDFAQKEFEERIIKPKRVSKKTTGGSALSFSVIVLVGDRKGRYGYAMGKSRDMSGAIAKASSVAKKNLHTIKLNDGTIAHLVRHKAGAADVMLKPAPKGTGIIAGGVVRQILELAGVRDISAKMFGSSNALLNLKATTQALDSLRG